MNKYLHNKIYCHILCQNHSSNLDSIIYTDPNSSDTFTIPIKRLCVRRTYGIAIVTAWNCIYGLFYINNNSDITIKKILTARNDDGASVKYDTINQNIIIKFSSKRYGGISILPF